MTTGTIVLIAVTLLILIAASAIFSAIETALFSLQPYHVERLKKRREDFAIALAELLENPRRLLSVILLCDALANFPLILICLYLLRGMKGALVPFWVAALLIFTLVVFVCDLVPKVAALLDPYRFARIGVRVLKPLMPVFDPVSRVLQRISDRIAVTIAPAPLKTASYLSEEELGTLVELSTEQGTLHETESEMIHEIIKLGDKTARDCMTPRVDTFTIPDDLTNDEVVQRLRSSRYRRVPIYGETPDEILGILDARDFLLEPHIHYTERLIAPSFVPETIKAIDLLRNFLNHPQGLAIVVDEHGGTEGIVTLADIIEEIISDAVPMAEHSLYIEAIADCQLIVNGRARLDDINEMLGSELKEEGIDTIGGLIFNRLGVVPRPGAQMDIDGLKLTIRRTSRKRVEEVLIVREPSPEEDEPEAGA
ncbi:MAG TPA: hemolysin family protein [Chthoniobacter sp.]|jgi:CBS domain containing-hemolysin-like protein